MSQQQKLAHKTKNRDSFQRKQCWWLPYVVLEFDKNEILIDALGGTIEEPVWMFQAHLYVSATYLWRVRFRMDLRVVCIGACSDVSRVSDIALQIYLRNAKGSQGGAAPSTDELGKSDLFMGNLTFVPDFDVMVRG